MDRIRVGIIGYGYWGPNLTRNFIELPGSEVVVIADLNSDRLGHIRSRYPHIRITTDYQDLFEIGVDAVVIATPPATHFPLARECLLHHVNVLVEKPIALNSRHAENLVELAEANDLILMVGHTFEYNPAVNTLKNLIDSGELGQLYYIDTARLNLGLFQRDTNVLWDLAPHDISILLYLLGRSPICVNSMGAACVFKGTHDVAYLDLTFPDCIVAHVHVSWLDPCKVRRVTVVGSKKMAVYNDVENLEKIKIYDRGVDAPAYTNSFGEFQCSYRYGDILIPYVHFTEPLRLECQHFLDSVRNHTRPCTSGQEGLNVVRVLEAAQRSLSNGGHQEVI